jgi:hypothetical protein
VETDKVTDVVRVMAGFAERTGLDPQDETPKRYLWTDAFAVCNYLGLLWRTGDEVFRTLALRLVDQVHEILGRYREDDDRAGWISGLAEAEGRLHPTRGGLRIGKQLPERGPGDPSDDRLEWNRDGQYYHYLTKWMHALDRVARVTGESVYLARAIEMAGAVHTGFTYARSRDGRKGMHWKMSTDLSRPLVARMGGLDPLEGWLTYLELEIHAFSRVPGTFHLSAEIADMAEMSGGLPLATEDPLTIGELLSAGCRVARVAMGGSRVAADIPSRILSAGFDGLAAFLNRDPLRRPASRRLPFRELGLSIGIHAVERLNQWMEKNQDARPDPDVLKEKTERLLSYGHLAEAIERFWMDEGNKETAAWRDHLDINSVMLATSLCPDGYLGKWE